jgi:hypothetical protein
MLFRHALQLCLVASMLLVACGDDSMPPMPAASLSCSFSNTGVVDAGMGAGATCLEYRGDVIPETCPAAAGYMETDDCPADGRLGTCVTRIERGTAYAETILIVYEEAALVANEESCRLGGGAWELPGATP